MSYDKKNEVFFLDNMVNFCSSNPRINTREKKLLNLVVEYLNCIEIWNKTHNIVSGEYCRADLVLNFYDSVVGGAGLELPASVYDAGSGGGFPGIPLAICFPDTDFHLVESSRKKCSFLRLIRAHLGLKNVYVENCRIESLEKQEMLVSRAAFSPPRLKVLMEACEEGGRVALWSTPKSRELFVRSAGLFGGRLVCAHDYDLLGEGGRSVLVFERRSLECST